MSGSKVPTEQYLHCRFRNAAQVQTKMQTRGSPATNHLGQMSLGPFDRLEKFPADQQKAVYTKFMLLVQVQKDAERVENVGLAFCDAMSKKDSMLLRADAAVLDAISAAIAAAGAARGVFFRKLRKFDWMALGPAGSLQEISRAAASNKDWRTPLADVVFEGKGSFTPVKKKALALEHATKDFLQKFNAKQKEALALEHATKDGPVVIQVGKLCGYGVLIRSSYGDEIRGCFSCSEGSCCFVRSVVFVWESGKIMPLKIPAPTRTHHSIML